MTVTPWTIYLITRLDAVCALLGIVFAMSLIALVIAVFFRFMDFDYYDEDQKRESKIAIMASIVLLSMSAIGCATIPTTKQAAAMYIIPAVYNSRVVQKLPAQIERLADEWVRELREE